MPEPQPYRRFDHKRQWSGLDEMGISQTDAANRLGRFLDTDFNALDRSVGERSTFASLGDFGKRFSQIGGGEQKLLRPDMSEAQGTQLDTDISLAQPVNRMMVEWVRKHMPHITSQSPEGERAQAFDAFIRYQQAKNQRPKRGITSSLAGKLILGGLTSLAGGFIGPALSNIVPGAVLSGLKTIGTVRSIGNAAKTIKDITTKPNVNFTLPTRPPPGGGAAAITPRAGTGTLRNIENAGRPIADMNASPAATSELASVNVGGTGVGFGRRPINLGR